MSKPPARKKQKKPRPWQDIAREAQEHRDATIALIKPMLPPLPAHLPKNVMNIPATLLTPAELRTTDMVPEDLLRELAEGRLTAEAVTTAFLRRAGMAQGLTNCVTELLPERALSRARFLDSYFATHRKPVGPLHGLPISVKEHIGMKGLTLNAGYVALYDKIAPEDAHVLQILERAGAVFHARTTEPQTLMHLETDSNLYGVTVNPYNADCTAGGSSGGEGALIGLRGSALGIGSDIAGSIRSPAANNGIYGFKPTTFRIPTDGWSSTPPGADPIVTAIGPLSTSISGLKLFMSTILASKPWLSEPALIPLSWNSNLNISPSPSQPLRIGILLHDNVVRPHPPITRALRTMASKLSALPNVTVVDWNPHLHDEARVILSSLLFPDDCAEEHELMAASGEPMLPLTEWLLKHHPGAGKLNMAEYAYWLEEREAYRAEYAKVWNDTATSVNEETGERAGMVDAILCPVGPSVAPKHNDSRYWGYTSQWNLLDYPAVAFPVDKVDKEVDVVVDRVCQPKTRNDEWNWGLYNPEAFDGLPISLQLVGRRFEDEKVLAVLEYIQGAIGLPFASFP